MMPLYSCALAIALVLSAPVWLWRMARQGRYREGLRGRLGQVPARLSGFIDGRPVVWLHAVSVGEVMAASRLVEGLGKALPGHALIVSTTTPTGQRVARDRFGVDRVFFFPIDFAFAVRPYLCALQPKLLVLMESELWPRMLVECERAEVKVAVVNGRVSDRSLPRYRALRMLWKPLLRRIHLLLAQSDEDARRWISIGAGADRVRTTGNIKFDVRASAQSPLALLLRSHIPAGVPVIVCGSTHEGEEDMLLHCNAVLRAGVTVLAHRHPERTPQVQRVCRDKVEYVFLLSQWRLQPTPLPLGSILIVDTVGDLAALYSLATVAVVGGSFVAQGGHNPLEPTQFGAPVVMGPHTDNFRAIVQAMQSADALRIVPATELCTTLQTLIDYPDVAKAMGERGRAVFMNQAGATQRTIDALLSLLNEDQR